MEKCPHCGKELEIDFWEYYTNKNPFDCPFCSQKVYLIFEEYYNEETKEEDTWEYLSKNEN